MFDVRQHPNKSIKWWFNHRDDIDMDPPYQRKGGVWTYSNKAYLIDSIINGYDIPKLYVADFTLSNTDLNISNTAYAIIDGRQRFETVFEFFEDQFSLKDDFLFAKDIEINLAGLRYSEIKSMYPRILEIIDEYNFHVMSVTTDEESKINELFIRLNSSQPLTGAEVRNAMQGLVSEYICNISKHSFFKDYIKFSTKRAQDKNLAAKLLLIEFRGKMVDTKRVNLDRFVREGVNAETDNFKPAAERVLSILDNMTQVFTKKDTLLSSQGQIPVYYWLIRNHSELIAIREFLQDFEAKRKRNSQIAKVKPSDADQNLLAYDVMRRSTNDQQSLIGRYKILEHEYRALLRTALKSKGAWGPA